MFGVKCPKGVAFAGSADVGRSLGGRSSLRCWTPTGLARRDRGHWLQNSLHSHIIVTDAFC